MSPTYNVLAGALAMAGSASAGIIRDPSNLISPRQDAQEKPGSDPIIKEAKGPTMMTPIRPDHEAKRKRALEGAFDIMKEDSLWWGDTSGTVAELKVNMPGETEGIVDTEYFDHMIEAMECPEGDSGEITMKFNGTMGEFSAASVQVWDWVNEVSDNSFLLMVGDGDCGSNEDRMVYKVSDMDFDTEENMATLTVEATTWKDSLHSFDLNLGNVAMNKEIARRLRSKNKRQLGDWIGNVVDNIGEGIGDAAEAVGDGVGEAVDTVEEGVGDAVDTVEEGVNDAVDGAEEVVNDIADGAEGVFNNVTDKIEPVIDGVSDVIDGEINPDFSIPLDFDVSGKGVNFNTGGVDFIGSCNECTAKGSFDVEAKFKMSDFEFEEAFLEIRTPGIEATAVIAATIRGQITDTLVEQSLPLFKFSPAGVAIPGVITLGPTVTIELKAGITGIQGGTTLTLGGTMTIPESSARLDFLNEEDMSSEGWEPEFEQEPLKADVFVEARATTSLSGSVGVEISALESGFDAEVSVALPALTGTLRAIQSFTCTACESFRNGIEGSVTLGSSITAAVSKKVGGTSQALWSLTFFDASLDPLASFCEGIGEECGAGNSTAAAERRWGGGFF